MNDRFVRVCLQRRDHMGRLDSWGDAAYYAEDRKVVVGESVRVRWPDGSTTQDVVVDNGRTSPSPSMDGYDNSVRRLGIRAEFRGVEVVVDLNRLEIEA